MKFDDVDVNAIKSVVLECESLLKSLEDKQRVIALKLLFNRHERKAGERLTEES